jgi:hypothetical protein
LGQAVILPLAAAAAVVVVVITAAAHGYIPDVAALALVCAVVLCGYQITRTRRLESAAYPAVGLALGAVFTMGLVTNLIRSGGTALSSAPAASTVQAPADSADAISVADPQGPPVAASRLPNRRR